MKIQLAKSAGFCFGVKRAINITLETTKKTSNKNNIYMLGDIVHNEEVIKTIKKSGIKKIEKLTKGTNKILLIRAHGTTIDIIEKAKELGYNIIDATCPMVKDIHKKAKELESENYKIIIIGEKKHDEIKGIVGQLKNTPIIANKKSDLYKINIKKNDKIGIIVQSTYNIEKALDIVDTFKKKNNNKIKFYNTICLPTRTKQVETKNLALKNNTIFVIGSTTSANTKRLYNISKKFNKKTYWIQTKKDIKKSWLKNIEKIGITAGASTPNTIIQEIIDYLKKQ